jgi:hypothetical protein
LYPPFENSTTRIAILHTISVTDVLPQHLAFVDQDSTVLLFQKPTHEIYAKIF